MLHRNPERFRSAILYLTVMRFCQDVKLANDLVHTGGVVTGHVLSATAAAVLSLSIIVLLFLYGDYFSDQLATTSTEILR